MSAQRPTVWIRFPEASGRPDLPLRLGDTLEARARLTGAGLILILGAHRLPARADVPVADGDRLRLRVASVGHPLVLQVTDHLGPRPALQWTLRQALPRQATAESLVGDLRSALRRPLTNLDSHTACQEFQDAVPSARSLSSAAGIRETLAHAGLYLEARLARGADTGADLKGRLSAWLAALRPRHPEGGDRKRPTPEFPPAERALLDQLEAFFWRIQALQAHRALHTRGTRDWTLDIPVRQGDALHALRLRIRPATGADGGAAWTIEARLALERLGPVAVSLHLAGGRADLAWWAQQRVSAERLANALPKLEQRLRAAGLEPGAITCYHGWPAHDGTAPSSTATQGIIDEQI
ncbi:MULTISPECIES: flagellar hook-length control protein FliK [Halorhodospira]|uniref:flagellar hook-length control protein FliK n=1 Tax=Halorhodospira TaxID=85108 RepID=UPI002378F524|nr:MULTISPECIES: flagellar hook-length control protein FliK [Halorhodospira]